MGRIADLCGDVAAAAEEGPEGLILSPEAWNRFRDDDWDDDDIQDALGFVHDSLLQGELVEAADSLSARLVELLGAFGESTAFHSVESGDARLSLEMLGQLARRVDRLEEVLEVFREGASIDRRGFDALQQRLANQGIEAEMVRERQDPLENGSHRGTEAQRDDEADDDE